MSAHACGSYKDAQKDTYYLLIFFFFFFFLLCEMYNLSSWILIAKSDLII